MAQNVANEKWAGNVTLSPWSFTIDANRLIIATSSATTSGSKTARPGMLGCARITILYFGKPTTTTSTK